MPWIGRSWHSAEIDPHAADASDREAGPGDDVARGPAKHDRKRAIEEAVRAVVPEQFMVLGMCESEKEQLALLERFQGEGLACKALLS
jgi:hypothetical protein